MSFIMHAIHTESPIFVPLYGLTPIKNIHIPVKNWLILTLFLQVNAAIIFVAGFLTVAVIS